MRPASCSTVLLGLTLSAGCALPRPEGAYDGPEPDAGRAQVDADPDSDEEIYRDAGGPPAPPADGEPPVESPLIGDYWMQVEHHTSVSSEPFGVPLRSAVDARVYALVAIRAEGQQLTFRDFQCSVVTNQTCLSGCRSISTVLRDPATSARAFLPPRRLLSLDAAGRFAVGAGAYAVGWRGDLATDPELTLPDEEDDPRVYDPDGGGSGVDVAITLRTALGLPARCDLRLLQRVDVVYEGALRDGRLVDGRVRDLGSTQRELANSCGRGEAEVSETAPSDLRLLPARTPIEVERLPWKCPPLAAFEAAFE